jgi:hypothetical protein
MCRVTPAAVAWCSGLHVGVNDGRARKEVPRARGAARFRCGDEAGERAQSGRPAERGALDAGAALSGGGGVPNRLDGVLRCTSRAQPLARVVRQIRAPHLAPGFPKVRSYGWLAPRNKGPALAAIRSQLRCPAPSSPLARGHPGPPKTRQTPVFAAFQPDRSRTPDPSLPSAAPRSPTSPKSPATAPPIQTPSRSSPFRLYPAARPPRLR